MKRKIILLLPFQLILCAILFARNSLPVADLILLNVKIVTVDKNFSVAQAVAIKKDKIIAVGTNGEIRKLSGRNGAMELSSAEGWNQTKNDWKFLIENPGNICMAAECDNKIIGTTTAINYSNQVAWIGMVLADKEYRGYGFSKMLLRNIFAKLEFCNHLSVMLLLMDNMSTRNSILKINTIS